MNLLGKYLRKTGINQRQLSRDTGISPSMICSLVGGTRLPGIVTGTILEDYTQGEVPLSYWIGRSKKRKVRA